MNERIERQKEAERETTEDLERSVDRSTENEE